MTALDASFGQTLAAVRAPVAGGAPAGAVDRVLGAGLVWLAVALSGFVLFEPAPSDVLVTLAAVCFFFGGLRLSARLVPLLPLALAFVAGGVLGLTQVADESLWVGISAYLALSAVFFAAYVATDPEPRLALIFGAWTLAAVIASLAAVVGYLGGIELFLKFERARGTFQDPNVLGPFLVAPAVYALLNGMIRRPHAAAVSLVLVVLFAAAVLLTFSRAAWGHLAASLALAVYFALATSRSSLERVRLVLLAGVGLCAVGIGLATLLSLDTVSGLFAQRASLSQEYDVGHGGRFDRHIAGFALALEKPLGIGPLQFNKLFPEDAHNVYLNAFMSYGWLGAAAYLALTAMTLWRALRLAFTAGPWRPYGITLAATFLPLAFEGAIIDTDHWRHYWLLLGLVWGLDAALHARRRGLSRLALGGWRV